MAGRLICIGIYNGGNLHIPCEIKEFFLKESDLEICLSNVNLRIVKNRIFLQLGFVVVSTI